MPRLRAIVLDSPDTAAGARASFRIAMWYDVPAARQRFWAAKRPEPSVWLDAQATDNTAIANGAMVEEVILYEPDGTKTAAVMESEVAALWNARQAQISAHNPWPNYGTTWDGTTWTVVTVA